MKPLKLNVLLFNLTACCIQWRMILSVSQEVALQDKATLLDQLDNKKMRQNIATNSFLFIEFVPYLC